MEIRSQLAAIFQSLGVFPSSSSSSPPRKAAFYREHSPFFFLPLTTTLFSSFLFSLSSSRVRRNKKFGPPAWRAFHLFAQNYPAQPTATVKAACVAFVNSVGYMLPCPHCGYDFISFIKVNDLYENSDPFNPACKGSRAYNMPCQGPVTACSNQANLVNYFLRAHYNVDTLTKPCKKLWTPSMAAAAYGQVEDFCANNIVFGTEQLCKSVGETGCVVA